MLRERADPAFAGIAEALFLAEYQMYHHALTRLPVSRNRGNLALSALAAATRSVIFRQMARYIKRSTDTPPCFLEWAELNEQYYRQQTEVSLQDVDQRSDIIVQRGQISGQQSERANSRTKHKRTHIT
jgi:hypothetical protein